MTVLTEGARDGEAIAWTVNPEYSFDQVTYAAGTNYPPCTVMKGPDTAAVLALPADTTGLFLSNYRIDATAAAEKGSALKRGAIVNGNLINYPAGATAPQRAAINAALTAVTIVVRT